MRPTEARILTELREAPEAVRRQGRTFVGAGAELIRKLKRQPPQLVVTCARGSSAHAATFGKHLIERHLGIPVAAAAPNIATVYRRRLDLEGQLVLAISQSGRSDDLVEFAAMARASNALVVAIVNDVDSPLAAASDVVLPLEAGPELSVAATKTFVTTLAALLRLTAAWGGDDALAAALERLPDHLATAMEADWSAALDTVSAANSLVTIGRGPTLAIAREASLKLKEIGNLHAEAFSGAEFLHGPIALVSSRFPILMFMPTDAAAAGMRELADDLRAKGASVLTTGRTKADRLATVPDLHPDIDAVCLVQSFYAQLVRFADRRGSDVDRPRHLRKVTRTR